MKLDFWIKAPGKGRRSFSILRRVNRGKAYTVQDERITVINRLLHEGAQDEQTCRRQIQAIVDELRGAAHPPERYLEANLDLFERYWAKHYEPRTCQAQSKESASRRFKRVLARLNELEIAVAPLEALQTRMNTLPPRALRSHAWCLNALLQYAGRADDKLQVPRKYIPPPRFLTESDFKLILPHLPPAWQALAGAQFGTGARFKEMFAMRVFVRARGFVHITHQRTEAWELVPTKNYKTRKAPVVQGYEGYVEKWIGWDEGEKRAMLSEMRAAEVIRAACREAKVVEITDRDIRHCYAIHLLTKMATLTMVARSLGNSLQVCQDYYAGYVLTDDEVEAVVALLRAA